MLQLPPLKIRKNFTTFSTLTTMLKPEIFLVCENANNIVLFSYSDFRITRICPPPPKKKKCSWSQDLSDEQGNNTCTVLKNPDHSLGIRKE